MDEIDGSGIPFAFLFYTNIKTWNVIEAKDLDSKFIFQ